MPLEDGMELNNAAATRAGEVRKTERASEVGGEREREFSLS